MSRFFRVDLCDHCVFSWRPEMSRRKFVRLSFDVLEERLAPAVLDVTRIGDSGLAGQLRTVIAAAATNDTIRIDLSRYGGFGSVIKLNQGPIETSKNLTIIGTRGVVIWGRDSENVSVQAFKFQRDNGPVTVSISGITFEDCRPTDRNGGAIFVRGNLTLTSCKF